MMAAVRASRRLGDPLPPGDLRNNIAASFDDSLLLVIPVSFQDGDLGGHAFRQSVYQRPVRCHGRPRIALIEPGVLSIRACPSERQLEMST